MAATVVLIDDDPDDLDIMKEAIASVDPAIECISFIYPVEAVRLLSKHKTIKPDFIFIDINMPRKPGPECLKELRKVDYLSVVPIVIYSTTISDRVSENLKKEGADFTFQKPSALKDYQSILQSILK